MMRPLALILVLAVTVGSTAADAQLGGLLRKKAGDVLGRKPEPSPTPPPPTPTPDASPSPAPESPAAPGPVTADRAPAPAPAPARDPLDIEALPVQRSAQDVFRGSVYTRSDGDWQQLPSIPPAAVAAAYALGESAQVTLVETVGAALKTLVMSDAFQAQHDEYVKREHKGVNHGLTGIVTMEDAVKRNDFKALEAIQMRMTVASQVELTRGMPADLLRGMFDEELATWKRYAADPQRRNRAKYQKLVAVAQPLEGLAPTDERFQRGWVVLKSIDSDGPDTEEAVLALYARQKQEEEQLAYDQHNLRRQLKAHLSNFVKIAGTVNFDAPTVEKNKQTVFANAADERRGALWKACFRAGRAPTAAAVKLAQAWLAEL